MDRLQRLDIYNSSQQSKYYQFVRQVGQAVLQLSTYCRYMCSRIHFDPRPNISWYWASVWIQNFKRSQNNIYPLSSTIWLIAFSVFLPTNLPYYLTCHSILFNWISQMAYFCSSLWPGFSSSFSFFRLKIHRILH